MDLENCTKEELIEMIYNMMDEKVNDEPTYKEEILQAEIDRYNDKLESMDYIDYGYGIGCYGAL